MTLSTYINFAGNCREAFEFYRSVFGGEFAVMETFRNGPPDMGMPDDELDNIMHVSFPIGTSVLMGSDVSSTFGASHAPGNNFSLSISTESVRSPTTYSPRYRKAAPYPCRCRICSGDLTSAHAPTSSASAGRSTASFHRSDPARSDPLSAQRN